MRLSSKLRRTSVSKYAERIGEVQNTVSGNKSAYEVFSYCKKSISQPILLGLSAKHFYLIHPLRKDLSFSKFFRQFL